MKASLLNELYVENEARLLYIGSMLATRQGIEIDVITSIAQRRPELVRHIQAARATGRPPWILKTSSPEGERAWSLRSICEFSHTMIGRARLDHLNQCLDKIREEGIPGDLIETGVWRGGASIFMTGYLAAHEMHDRTVWVADSFEGLPKPTLPEDADHDFSAETVPVLAISLEEVKENFRRYGLLDERVRFLKGWFKDTLPTAPIRKLALARLDGDLYESTRDALNALYDKLVPGAFLLVDDYGDLEPCRRAVDEFRRDRGISAPLVSIDWSSVYWRV